MRGTVPKVKVTYHHTICQHCDDAPCIEACPANAIYKRDDGIVIIDPEKCRGNKMCIAACPYEGVIYFNDDLNIAQKCTFCAHLLDRGWTETRCVDACPTGAFTFGEEDDPAIKAKIAAGRAPQARASPPVPASTTSTCPRSGSPARSTTRRPTRSPRGATSPPPTRRPAPPSLPTTDHFGDFWLKDLADGTYTLLIEKPGYLAKKLGPIDATAADQNLGDIELWKA